MKTIYLSSILIAFVFFTSCNQKPKETAETSQPIGEGKKPEMVVIQQQAEPDTLKGSLKAIATGKIGNSVITINYHSPAVRGRVIWGGLVPFEQVWVTGAHRATSIEFEGPVQIEGVKIPAGKYALFTIPSKTEWTIIINKNWDQHLTDDYDAKDDLVRVKVKPETEEPHQERLRYVIEEEGSDKGEVVVYWEKLEISLPVTALN
jgi:Protein of unknown function (DUF2911)